MRGREVITQLDLSEAYLQLRLSKEAQKYVRFQHQSKTYQFVRFPFGLLANVGLKSMLGVFSTYLGQHPERYLDVSLSKKREEFGVRLSTPDYRAYISCGK